MTAKLDLVGRTYGVGEEEMLVLEARGSDKRGRSQWLVRCHPRCGRKFTALGSNLQSGQTTSCGHPGTERMVKYAHDKVLTFQEMFDKYVPNRPEGECWIWEGPRMQKAGYPEGTYGLASSGYSKMAAHRLSWLLHYGDPGKMLVRHKVCDNPPCCNPTHLMLGTYADNNRDRVEHGRHRSRTKDQFLTPDVVQAIRERYARGGITQRELCEEYGISASHLGHIVNNKAHTGLPSKTIKMSQEKADEIRAKFSSGAGTRITLAKEYNITSTYVSMILRGEVYSLPPTHAETTS